MVSRTKQEQDDRLLLENSIERVINTSLRVIDKYASKRDEDVNTNLQDWHELKWLVVELWNTARNEAFKRGQK